MLEAVLEGARDPNIEGVEVVARPALVATAVDVMEADGYLLGTSANLGYMSGALKHLFDLVYYPCLNATARRPYGLYLHGNDDTTGAERAIAKIVTGLGWRQTSDVVVVTGAPTSDDLDRCRELGGALAAGLTL